MTDRVKILLYVKANKKINCWLRLSNATNVTTHYCGGNDWVALFYNNYRSSGTAFGRLNVFVINETLGDLGTWNRSKGHDEMYDWILQFICRFGWSLVAMRWASDWMNVCPQTAEVMNVCQFSFRFVFFKATVLVLKKKKSLLVCGRVNGWFNPRCSCLFTLLPMVVEKRAVRMSGRCSSLQPLLSMSLALDLYLACARKTTRQHTHTQHAADEKPRWCSVPSKWLELSSTL